MKDVLPPACKSLRDNLVLGLKLFDFAHFSYGRPYLALDTDVLFFRNPVELYEALSGTNICVLWNQGPPEAVSLCILWMKSSRKRA
jgi:hypothetical protein